MSRPSVTNPRDLTASMVIVGVVAYLMFGCVPMAHAGGARRVVQQQVVASPYLYQVAPQLQQQGMQVTGDMYQRLRELEAWKAGVEFERAGRASAEQPQQPMPHSLPPATPAEPTPAVDPEFAVRYPLISAKCVRCHTGENPKGDVWLDGTAPLDGPDAAGKRDAIVRMTYLNAMPKGKPLEDSEFGQLLAELYPPDPETPDQ